VGKSACLKTERNGNGMARADGCGVSAGAGAKTNRRLPSVVKTRQAKQLAMGTIFVVLLAGGWFAPVVGYFIPLCMVAGIGVALFRGRQWCNWYCPRGSFADSIMKRISPVRPMPRLFRTTGLRLTVLTFLMAVLAFRITALWPDFHEIGRFFMILLTVTTAAGLILAAVFHHRAWCAVCPIGSLSSWVGRNRYPLAVEKDKCVDCGACARKCPMQLEPQKLEEGAATRGDCVKCGLCVQACGKEALTLGRRGQ